MASPVLSVELALGNPPLTPIATAAWVNVSSAIYEPLSMWIKRGRQDERGEFEAGRAILTLNNADRRFDPSNTAGPYYGQLKPMVKIRIGATWAGTPYWLFTGYVEAWQPVYPGGTISYTTLTCVDGFKAFNLIKIISAARPQERSGARVDATLTAIGWPASERSIAVGDIDVPAMELNQSALSLMQNIATAERSAFFVSGAGTVTFEDRSFRDTVPVTDIWGDAPNGSELPYSSVDIRFDDSRIWNQIRVSRYQSPTEPQVAYDATSRTDFFLRDYTLENQLFVNDTEALAAADLMLARYKDARRRPVRMVIDPGVRGTYTNVLRREISDVITIKQRNLRDSGVTSLDAHIEAVEWTIEKELWTCVWQLSPHFTAATGTSVLVTQSIWRAPTLENGWNNVGVPNVISGYYKDKEGWVHLRGLVGSGTAAPIFRLPDGYRPAAETRFAAYTNSGTFDAADITIIPTGVVSSSVFGFGITVDLSGISFRLH